MPERRKQLPPTGMQPRLPPTQAFVVQFRWDTDPQQGRFVGRVEHIASGRACHFRSAEEILNFVATILAGGCQPPCSVEAKGGSRE